MNELEILFIAKAKAKAKPVVVKQDMRYRMLVTLIRSDRPRYWSFLCMNCGSKIGELQNYEVIGADDFYDPQNVNNHGFSRDCKGTIEATGRACPYTYVFRLQ